MVAREHDFKSDSTLSTCKVFLFFLTIIIEILSACKVFLFFLTIMMVLDSKKQINLFSDEEYSAGIAVDDIEFSGCALPARQVAPNYQHY